MKSKEFLYNSLPICENLGCKCCLDISSFIGTPIIASFSILLTWMMLEQPPLLSGNLESCKHCLSLKVVIDVRHFQGCGFGLDFPWVQHCAVCWDSAGRGLLQQLSLSRGATGCSFRALSYRTNTGLLPELSMLFVTERWVSSS